MAWTVRVGKLRKLQPQTNLVLLLSGSAVSTFGNALVLVALLVHLAGFADSARLIGLVQGSAYLPMALFSYAAGAWADRHSPRRIIIWTDLLRGLAMLGGGLMLALAPEPGSGLVVILPLVFVMGTLQSLFIPGVVLYCVDVERQLAAGERRVRVLGLRNASTHGATLAGNAVGGSLYLLLGLPALLMFNGLGFVLSALSEVFLSELPGAGQAAAASPPAAPAAPIKPAAMLQACRTILRTAPVDLYLLVQIVIPLLTMVLPAYLTGVMGLPAPVLGLVFALLLGGSIAAGLTATFRAGQPHGGGLARRIKPIGPDEPSGGGAPLRSGRYRTAYLPGFVAGLLLLAIALLGKALPWPLGAGLLAGLGYCLGTLYLRSVEAVQSATQPGQGGRGHGMLESLSSIITPASYYLGAIVLGSGIMEAGRLSAGVWVAGLAVLLAGYALWAGLRSKA